METIEKYKKNRTTGECGEMSGRQVVEQKWLKLPEFRLKFRQAIKCKITVTLIEKKLHTILGTEG